MDLPLVVSMFSTGVAAVAVWFAVAALNARPPSPRRVQEIEYEQAEIVNEIVKLKARMTKLVAREGMARAREAKAEQQAVPDAFDLSQQPGETPDQWKARVRKNLATRSATNGR